MESRKHSGTIGTALVMAPVIACIIVMTALLAAGVCANVESMSIITLSVLNQNPSPALAGDTVDIRVGVENFGGEPVNDLVLEIVPSYPFSIVDMTSSIQELGNLGEGQSNDNMKIAKFKVRVSKDVSAGTYMLKIRRYERGYEDKAVVFNFPVDIKGRESAQVLFIDKNEIIPGQVTPLKFTVNNVGNAPLRDLIFSWSNSDKVVLPVGSDNTRQIRYLDVGQSVDLDFTVIADPSANPGLYPIDMRLQYLDTINGTMKTITTGAGIYVGGGTDFDVAFSQSSGGQTAFSVANIGSNQAYSVSVIVPEQTGWTVSGTNDVIIGNLDKGDYTVASFAIKSPAGAGSGSTGSGSTSGRYGRGTTTAQAAGDTATAGAGATAASTAPTSNTITLRIQYTDTKGTRQTVDKTVKLLPSDVTSTQSTTATTAQSTSLWSSYKWYIIGALIVLIFFGWRRYAKRSRQKALSNTASDKKKR